MYKKDGNKKLRFGFTTGSCSAAAAKAAAWMLFSGTEKSEIEIMTPKGLAYTPLIDNIVRSRDAVSCSVTKDGGDDPDVTNGMPVIASVSLVLGKCPVPAGKRKRFGIFRKNPQAGG